MRYVRESRNGLWILWICRWGNRDPDTGLNVNPGGLAVGQHVNVVNPLEIGQAV